MHTKNIPKTSTTKKEKKKKTPLHEVKIIRSQYTKTHFVYVPND